MHSNDHDDWGQGPRGRDWDDRGDRDDRPWEDRRGGGRDRGENCGPRGPRGGYPGRGPREEFGGRGPRERGRDRDRGRERGREGGRNEFGREGGRGSDFGGFSGFFGPDGPFGATGPFGPNGPFGANGPFGEDGPFGPRGPFGGPGRAGRVGPIGHISEDPRGRRGGHRGHRGGSRGGRGGRARRGEVRLAVLGLLAEEDMNGYQIIRALEERTGGAWRPSPGAIYPALAQLEDEGLIAPAEGGKKVFTLTDAGRAEVEQLGEKARPWEGVAQDATAEAEQGLGGTAELWIALGQLGLATRAVGQAGDPDVTRAATELLEESRRGLYRLLAEQNADDLEDDDVQDEVPGDRDDDDDRDDAEAVIEGEVVDDGEGPDRH